LLLIPWLLLIELWHHHRDGRRIARDGKALYGSLLAITLGYFLYRHAVLGTWLVPSTVSRSVLDKLFLVPYTVSRYLIMTFLPIRTIPYYNILDWVAGPTPAWFLGLLLIAGAGFAVWYFRQEMLSRMGWAGLAPLPAAGLQPFVDLRQFPG